MMTKIRYRSDVLKKEFLEECFEANFEEGTLKWKARPRRHFLTQRAYAAWNTNYVGIVAGTTSWRNKKYFFKRVTLCKMYFPIHHVVWTMFYGEMFDTKQFVLDHLDRNPLNNAITNLRLVTQQENTWNSPGTKGEKSMSKFKGVCWDKNRDKWYLQFRCGDLKIKQRFDNEGDAAYIYKVISDQFHTDMSADVVQSVDIPPDFSDDCIKPKLRNTLLGFREDVKLKNERLFSML